MIEEEGEPRRSLSAYLFTNKPFCMKTVFVEKFKFGGSRNWNKARPALPRIDTMSSYLDKSSMSISN